MNALEEYKNEEAIDLLADLLEPVSRMMENQEFREAIQKGKTKIEIARVALKSNKAEVIEILAICDGVKVEEYNKNAIQITADFMRLMANKEVAALFR